MTGRKQCLQCQQLLSHCLCAQVQARESKIPLLILQYTKEAQHHKNTVGLLTLAVPNCIVIKGYDFDWLTQASQYHVLLRNAYLLYPGEKSRPLLHASVENTPPPSALVVIDASWKKSKRIYLTTPWLHQLQAVHLSSVSLQAPSAYSIRKSAQGHFRSTFEASLLSLSVLEHYPIDPAMQLLNAFCALKHQDVNRYRNR